MKAILRKMHLPRITTHGFLILLGLVWIYPFLWMVSASFKTPAELFSQGLKLLPEQFNFDNYIRAWNVANFSTYFLNTVIVTVATVAIVLFLTSTLGYVLGRYDFPGKKIVIIAIVATIFMPSRYNVIPIFDLINRLGLLNTLWGLILSQAGIGQTLYILLFASYFRGLPKELEESATIDGANFLQIFWRIMLPLATPIIGTVAIFQFMSTWNEFFFPLILTLGKPAIRTLGVGMYAFVGEHSFDWTGAAAAASISIIPVIIVFLIFQRLFIDSVAGAIKG